MEERTRWRMFVDPLGLRIHGDAGLSKSVRSVFTAFHVLVGILWMFGVVNWRQTLQFMFVAEGEVTWWKSGMLWIGATFVPTIMLIIHRTFLILPPTKLATTGQRVQFLALRVFMILIFSVITAIPFEMGMMGPDIRARLNRVVQDEHAQMRAKLEQEARDRFKQTDAQGDITLAQKDVDATLAQIDKERREFADRQSTERTRLVGVITGVQDELKKPLFTRQKFNDQERIVEDRPRKQSLEKQLKDAKAELDKWDNETAPLQLKDHEQLLQPRLDAIRERRQGVSGKRAENLQAELERIANLSPEQLIKRKGSTTMEVPSFLQLFRTLEAMQSDGSVSLLVWGLRVFIFALEMAAIGFSGLVAKILQEYLGRPEKVAGLQTRYFEACRDCVQSFAEVNAKIVAKVCELDERKLNLSHPELLGHITTVWNEIMVPKMILLHQSVTALNDIGAKVPLWPADDLGPDPRNIVPSIDLGSPYILTEKYGWTDPQPLIQAGRQQMESLIALRIRIESAMVDAEYQFRNSIHHHLYTPYESICRARFGSWRNQIRPLLAELELVEHRLRDAGWKLPPPWLNDPRKEGIEYAFCHPTQADLWARGWKVGSVVAIHDDCPDRKKQKSLN